MTGADTAFTGTDSADTDSDATDGTDTDGTDTDATDTDRTAAGSLPLTAAQQGIVDAMVLWPRSPVHILAECLDFDGEVDADLLAAAIEAMVAETSAQRIRLTHNARGDVVQVVDQPSWVPIDVVDLTTHPDPEQRAAEITDADATTGADPFVEVTTRHLVLRLGAGHLRWYHRAHHVALDGYGFSLCAQRVADHYRRLSGAAPDVDPAVRAGEPTDAYRELIAADTAYRSSQECDTDGAYWRELLGERPVHSFAAGTTAGPADRGRTPLRVRRTVTTWPARPDLPYPELITAVVAIHLSRALRRRDVVIGMPMMNRLGSVAARVPGMIVNAIAVPVHIDSADTVATLARRIGRDLRRHRRHARYRHEWLRRDLSRVGGGRALFGPLVNIMAFDYEWPVPDVDVGAHNVTAGPVEDIAFHVYLRRGEVQVCLDAEPSRYRPDEVAAHLDAVIALVARAATDGTTPVDALGRDHRVLATPSTAPAADPMRILDALADENPAAAALVTAAGGVVSRGELREMIGDRARELSAHGVTAGSVVPVVPGDRVADIVTILAAQRLGAAHAATRPGENDAAADATGAPIPGGYVVTTSGSTGTPKTVRVGGHALAAFVSDAVGRYRWGPGDVVAQLGPLDADTSIEEIFVTLASGAALAVPDDSAPRTAGEILDLAGHLGITVLDLPTALFHELVLVTGAEARTTPPTLRQIVIGGEEASPDLTARWLASTGVEVINSYGPSEAAVVAIAGPLRSTTASTDRPVPLGTLLPHTGAALRVEDADPQHRWDDHSHSGIGELVLFGPILAEGYGGAEAGSGFGVLDLGGGPVRVFATGDVVRVHADGAIDYLDRTDGVLKMSGGRVHLRTIEDAVGRLPGVTSAMVRRCGAYALEALVTGALDRASEDAMRTDLAAVLPPAWVPARITVVDALPRTATGKLDRTVLRSPPPGPLRDAVRHVVADILGRPPADDDSIFAAGITSLQAVAIAGRVGAAAGRTLRVDDILDAATVAAIAERAAQPEQRIDLAGEVAALLPGAVAKPPRSPDPRVLLTGATGFVGGAVLDRLLRSTTTAVVLPIRASDEAAAWRRLAATGDPRMVALIDAARRDGRLTVLACADLVEGVERAGTCSHVIHVAAEIRAIAPYSELRAANVAVTAALARAAAADRARMVYASTVTAAGPGGGPHPDPETLPNGYAQSKSVAEHVVSAAGALGADPAIVRLPRVLPAAAGEVRSGDFLVRLAQVVARVGALPDTALTEPMSRVDDVAAILADAAFASGGAHAAIRDVYSPEPVPVVEVLRHAIGEVPVVPLDDWRDRVVRSTEIDASDRAAATVWCDIQLGGFAADWSSAHAVHTRPVGAATAARLLGIDRIGAAAPVSSPE
ncbi:hypothetical protein GCM10009624_03040 [Gordonia sinesedis]